MSAEVAIPAASIVSGLTALAVGVGAFFAKTWFASIKEWSDLHAETLAEHAERLAAVEAQAKSTLQRFDELRADLRAINDKLDRLIEARRQ